MLACMIVGVYSGGNLSESDRNRHGVSGVSRMAWEMWLASVLPGPGVDVGNGV